MKERLKDTGGTDIIGKLADGIAHEMNNVLATIMGLASVLETEISPNSLQYQDIQEILSASRRGLELTRNLLSFASKDAVYIERIDLNHLVGTVRSLLQRTIPNHISVQTHLAPDLADIEGDASQIKHLLFNLATNSTDAIRNKGTLTFTTKNVMVSESDAATQKNLNPGFYVRLQISDTGVGMDRLTLERAFEPFFTTKNPEQYSGLGLVSVLNTIRSHGGDIDIYSKEGLGTTATVYFPALESIVQPEVTAPVVMKSLDPKKDTILLVDDEELFRKASKRILERLGYGVALACNGQEALEYYVKNKHRISYVLLDLIMPDMDGAEVLEKLRGLDPEVRVIISTGYAREDPIKEMMQKGAVGFVKKPFTMKQLATVFKEQGQT